MSTPSVEKEKVYRLLQSGQLENITLGLEIAQALNVDILSFVEDVETLFLWVEYWHDSAAKLVNLARLTLEGNKLEILPNWIGKLTKLNILCIAGNGLRTLPPEIGNLADLQELEVEYNLIHTLPPEIGKLTNLKKLNLEHDLLTHLPEEIRLLAQLEELTLSGNPMTEKVINEIRAWLPHCNVIYLYSPYYLTRHFRKGISD